jgi:hypothetical protein
MTFSEKAEVGPVRETLPVALPLVQDIPHE